MAYQHSINACILSVIAILLQVSWILGETSSQTRIVSEQCQVIYDIYRVDYTIIFSYDEPCSVHFLSYTVEPSGSLKSNRRFCPSPSTKLFNLDTCQCEPRHTVDPETCRTKAEYSQYPVRHVMNERALVPSTARTLRHRRRLYRMRS
ncbi:uncharacterized protein [Watersipora subatra]|uniref:uncharacterized protein n=1 Tax=Watersipora subatra TaxID=2589382 RepID=UPI00355B58EF